MNAEEAARALRDRSMGYISGSYGGGKSEYALGQAFKDCNREGMRVLMGTDPAGPRFIRNVGSGEIPPRTKEAAK